jgi:hypothetical protein
MFSSRQNDKDSATVAVIAHAPPSVEDAFAVIKQDLRVAI